jgi:hypothetical protein
MCTYRVTSVKEILGVLIPHFDKYPLRTQKAADCSIFKEIVTIMDRNGHLTVEGLQTILNLRASLNLGLSEALKAAFPNTIPVARSLVLKPEVPHAE